MTTLANRAPGGWWEIGYPTGDARFHGTQAQVRAVMRTRIEAEYHDVKLEAVA